MGSLNRNAGLDADGADGAERPIQLEQVLAPAMVRIEGLEVEQPRGAAQVGNGTAAPAQFPHPRQPGPIPRQVGGLQLLQAFEQRPQHGRIGAPAGPGAPQVLQQGGPGGRRPSSPVSALAWEV